MWPKSIRIRRRCQWWTRRNRNKEDNQEDEEPCPHLVRKVRGLQEYNAPGRLGLPGELTKYMLLVNNIYHEPVNFEQAWYHEDENEMKN